MQKIVHVTSGKGLGGSRTVYLAHQSIFSIIGIETTCVLRPGALLKNFIDDKKTEVREINYNRRLPIMWQKTALNFMRELAETADIIWVHKPLDAYIWSSAIGDTHAKIVLVVHDFHCRYLECADFLIAVSNGIYNHLIENGFKNVYLINNFLLTPISKHEIKWNKKIQISSFGIFRKTKGGVELLQSIRVLKKFETKNDYEFHLYGKGVLAPLLKIMKFIFKLDRLTIHPWTRDAETKMRESDIVVISSRRESFGMIAIEAMSQGALVISTKCGGPEDIITDNINGMLTEVRDPMSLAIAIKNVINKTEEFLEIRKSGRGMVSQCYTIDSAKKCMSDVLKLM